MTVGELEQMPNREFEDWLRFHDEEPFGAPWENWLMAVPALDFRGVHRGKGKPTPKFGDLFFKGPQAQQAEKETKVESLVDMFERRVDKNG